MISLFNNILEKASRIGETTERLARTPWHTYPLEKVFEDLKSSPDGLAGTVAIERLAEYGPNAMPQKKGDPAWKLFLSQFNSPLMYIMLVATIVSILIQHTSDAIFISVVMISNAVVGFYQEYKANKSLQSLKALIQQKARVVRGGYEQEVSVQGLVPGDVIVLRAGDKVPADGRVVTSSNFKVNEASLTGESRAVLKNDTILEDNIEIADRTNMVFMGTIVEEGTAHVMIVETGIHTEYGDIVHMLADTEEEATPLQKTVAHLSKVIGIFITLVVGIILLEGFIVGKPVEDLGATALALFVSAIPEGLLPAITIVLTLGMRRILKHRGLVRRLAATETLGGVTVICTDKTGTLTQGNMAISHIVTSSGLLEITPDIKEISPEEHEILTTGILSIDAYIENPGEAESEMIFRGRPTEQAFLKLGVHFGIIQNTLDQQYPEIDTIFFSSDRKYSGNLRAFPNNVLELSVVGAPERIFERITSLSTPKGVVPAKGKKYQNIIDTWEEFSKKGYRIIAVAYRTFEDVPVETLKGNLEEHAKDLVLMGIIVLDDPVRPDVAEAFRETATAGIRTIIVTGDNKATAQAVAANIGFVIQDDQILEGRDLEEMDDVELDKRLSTVLLFARVSPRHKLRIVQLLQRQGEVVAMFGDGVNDTPALKAADIGVAVNSEIDAAREVADIVLLDGSFKTIVKAVEQGRIIFLNIRRVFLYLITQDFSQFFLFFVCVGLGLPLPLLAAQLLLVNLVESGLPDLALTTEEERDGIMQEPPRNPHESIVDKSSLALMFSVFGVSGGIVAIFYFCLYTTLNDLELTRTMIMTFLCLESLFLALSLRSFRKPIIRKDIFDNKFITGAVVISFAILLAMVYVEPFQSTLHLVPLTLGAWGLIISINIVEILIIDHFKRKYFKRTNAGLRAA